MAKIGYAELGQSVEVLNSRAFKKTIDIKEPIYNAKFIFHC